MDTTIRRKDFCKVLDSMFTDRQVNDFLDLIVECFTKDDADISYIEKGYNLCNMTEKEESILLTDLCGRLPYGLICHCNNGLSQADLILNGINERHDYIFHGETYCWHECIFLREDGETYCCLRPEWIKPYLRTMSSMTDEEREEYEHIAPGIVIEDGIRLPNVNQINWLNCHHFDYRELIEKGLALEAPGDMYVLKSV